MDALKPKRRGASGARLRLTLARLSLLIIAAHWIAGCTAMGQQSLVSGAQFAASPIYLDNRPRTLGPNEKDRFACRTGVALECRCMGRLGDCDCSCPISMR